MFWRGASLCKSVMKKNGKPCLEITQAARQGMRKRGQLFKKRYGPYEKVYGHRQHECLSILQGALILIHALLKIL